jgi:hypothetical protein
MSETMLYRFFDKNETLLYVGESLAGPPRWAEHRRNRPWWHELSDVKVEIFSTKEAAKSAEWKAIQTENPKYNIKGKRPYVIAPIATPCIMWGRQQFDLDVCEMKKKHAHYWAPLRVDPCMETLTRSPFSLDINKWGKWVEVILDYSCSFSYAGASFSPVIQALNLLLAAETNEDQFATCGDDLFGNRVVVIQLPIEIANFGLRAVLLAEQGDGSWTDVIEQAIKSSPALTDLDEKWRSNGKGLRYAAGKARAEIVNHIDQNVPYERMVAA